MKHWKIFLVLLVIGLLGAPQAFAIGEQNRQEPAVEISQEYVEESSSDVLEDDAGLFLEFEILESVVNDESELEEFEDFLNAPADDEIGKIPVEVSWTWGVSNLQLNQDTAMELSSGENQFNSRFDPARIGVQDDQYLAAAGLTGEVANVEVYTEFGIAGGQVPNLDERVFVDEEFEEAIELDLGTYYVAGGANMGLGRWKLGVEAGYGSSSNSSSSSQQSFSGLFEGNQLIGSQQIGSNGGLTSGSMAVLDDDPFKLVYFQGVANRNVTESIGFNIGAICFAVPEEFIQNLEGTDLSSYGLELFGDVNYQFTKSFKYSLYMDYSLTDENFEREDIYQILNKLEFNF